MVHSPSLNIGIPRFSVLAVVGLPIVMESQPCSACIAHTLTRALMSIVSTAAAHRSTMQRRLPSKEGFCINRQRHFCCSATVRALTTRPSLNIHETNLTQQQQQKQILHLFTVVFSAWRISNMFFFNEKEIPRLNFMKTGSVLAFFSSQFLST